MLKPSRLRCSLIAQFEFWYEFVEEANKRLTKDKSMFLAEYNRLRNYTKFVIEEGNLESIEDGLLDELYDTSNEYPKSLLCMY